MEGDRYVEADPYFETQPLLPAAIVLEGLAVISHNAVNEQITKANKRLAAGDFAGAIASSYTLTEHLLKLILRGSGVAYNENEGDIQALYKLVRESLNLNPAGEAVAAPLKPSCRPGGRSRAMARDRQPGGGGTAEIRRALSESRRPFVSIGLLSAFVTLPMPTGALFMLQVYDGVRPRARRGRWRRRSASSASRSPVRRRARRSVSIRIFGGGIPAAAHRLAAACRPGGTRRRLSVRPRRRRRTHPADRGIRGEGGFAS